MEAGLVAKRATASVVVAVVSILTFFTAWSNAEAQKRSTLKTKKEQSIAELRIRFEPQGFGGPLNNSSPTFQNTAQAFIQVGNKKNWNISGHFETEMFGAQELGFDLSEFWYRTALSKQAFTFGRIHPFVNARDPNRNRPWNLIGQYHAQNRGIALGNGFSGNSYLAQPLLSGWIGAHYDSAKEISKKFALSASFTPFFIPTIGSQIEFSESEAAQYGRFAQPPPAEVVVDGNTYPLRYSIDDEDIFARTFFQPQAMIQARLKLKNYRSWLSASYGPNPDPSPDVDGVLDVTQENLTVLATVDPKFENRFLGSYHQAITLTSLPWNWRVHSSHTILSDGRIGLELGTQTDYFQVSLLEEWDLSEENNSEFSNPVDPYLDLLFQASLEIPVYSSVVVFSDLKTHLNQSDLWLRTGVGTRVLKDGKIELGTDIFSGPDSSYFGQWRANDRVYLGLSWRLRS